MNNKQQILELEATITDRRRDEAILGQDNGWLASLRAQIAALREQTVKITCKKGCEVKGDVMNKADLLASLAAMLPRLPERRELPASVS